MPDPGVTALIPTLLVFALAVITRRPIESLISGALVGLVMLHGGQFITGFADTTIRVMTDEDVAWVILVCGFMGSLIALFKTMIEPLAVLVAAFVLKDVNDGLGLATYVVHTIEPLLTPALLPVIIFITMALVSFATGSNWGVFVIVLPIVTSLANGLGADMTLVIGATLSASTFGSHACFYSDATVLTAQATGTTPMQHALTQFPYALIAAAVTIVGYLILAFI